MRPVSSVLTALALLYADNVNAFWRMNCGIIQRGRIDPLVSPGQIAAHVHTIVGASNIGINATYETLFASECTSCEIRDDKSAYWTPEMYYQYPNGSFYEVPHHGAVAYYLGRGPNVAETVPFPPNLNILSGSAAARSYDSKTYTWGNAEYPGRPVADRVSFNCLHKDGPLPEQPYMFRTDCAYGLRAQIHFQSCWDGVNLYKADNSHVAYQSAIDNGICPPTHPVQIPHLFLEVLYSVADVPDQTDDGQFVFAQGDPTGYGFHGDFQNGWDLDVLANATTDCLATDNFGQIDACPILQKSQTNGYSYNCPERPPQIGEVVTGLLDKLPGCIEITYGPEMAPAASMNCPPSAPKPSVTATIDSTPLPTNTVAPGNSYGLDSYQQYVGCFNDSAGGVRALNSIQMANYSSMTVAFCQSWCEERGYRLSGVEFAQECHCDNAINPTSISGSDQCSWNCGGTMVTGGAQDICGGLDYISIYNNTDPNFDAFGSNENSAGNVSPPKELLPYADNYLGCATDNYNGGGRALTGPNVDWFNMTTQICADYCASQGPSGYQYYGLEFRTQCWCGNTIAGNNFITDATTNPSDAICNTRCTAAGDQQCGGPNAISLYNNTAYQPPSIKSAVGKYVTKGCLTDPNSGNGRALQGAAMTNETLSADSCVKFCLGNRFHYSGMEYGRECYCGNDIAYGSGAQVVECDLTRLTLCEGNSLQYCGGGSLLSLYYSATL
ncbi:hypothetical protein PRZ48_007625 [Zasmidium cellare]|uniref:WSC domain-containing protein n=1 Tax=Zasmidium cellare TaxID=395010 RepID=A0ABR0EKX6_ZASCE|nr:hypothetical protein PRZ48_007625 [Zasmidium cellare]